MKLLSVNVSLPKEVSCQGRTVSTGIFKEPVKGRVMLMWRNLSSEPKLRVSAASRDVMHQ